VIPFSILDLSPIRHGGTAAEAIHGTRDLAQHAERWGYNRFWLAEHHNMPGIASAATAVLIGHVAASTETIRVGAGGVMLPNHSPLVIAEQFGTLETLYQGRIDLGLGRAPGADQMTSRALRHDLRAAHGFDAEVEELRRYLRDAVPGQAVRAVPGAGTNVPIWILGSSTDSARLAAARGLPYAFASHFAPAQLMAALELYRNTFRPSEDLERPYVMIGLNAVVGDTDAEAQDLFSSMQVMFRDVRRGRPGQLRPPVADLEISAPEAAGLEQMLWGSAVGSPDTVRERLRGFREATGADELLFTSQIYDHAAALRSYELLAGLRDA
jgi:luciferase family oxidoreductase group 1